MKPDPNFSRLRRAKKKEKLIHIQGNFLLFPFHEKISSNNHREYRIFMLLILLEILCLVVMESWSAKLLHACVKPSQ